MPQDIQVRVTPRAKKNFVKYEGSVLKVYTTAPALEGRANEAVLEALAEHLNVKKRQLEITRGFKSRDKVVRVTE